MNTVFTRSFTIQNSRRRLLAWMIAAGFAAMLTIGQPALGQLFGVDWTPTASACQTQGPTGEC
ncbi:MAG: hypothetical protein R2867_16015 [Caldilineaceae bacterium]